MVSRINGGASVPTFPTETSSDTANIPQGDNVSTVAKGDERGSTTSPGNGVTSPKVATTSSSTPSIPAGRTGSASTATLQSGSSGTQVTQLQKDVNDWRTQNGQLAISEAGKFNTETKDAVTGFQKANGLKENGIADIPTQSRLELENNANFKQLTDPTKTLVRDQMTSYGSDTQKLQNTTQLATSPGFKQLSEDQQKQMLENLNKRPSDQNLAGELTTFSNSATFRGLPDADKSKLTTYVSNTGSAASYVQNMNNDQLLTFAETPTGQSQLTALGEAIQSGGVTRVEKPQLDRIGAATFTPGVGIAVAGSAADQATYTHMVRREMLASPSFKSLMDTQNADAAHPISVTVGRSAFPGVPGIFLDAFKAGGVAGAQTIDLDDLEKFPENAPAANPDAMTRGENLVHSMAEARQGALGNEYMPSHARAIQAENQYRADVGQTSKLRMPLNDITGPEGDLTFHFNNGYSENVKYTVPAGTITGIVRTNH